MAKVAKNASYYTIGSLIKAATSFVLLPLFSNILGAEQYGILNVLQTFSSILGVFMTLATERSLFRLYYDYKTEESKRCFLSTVFWAINGISLIMIVLTLFTGKYLVTIMGNIDVWRLLLPTVVYTYFIAIVNYSQVLMQVEQKGSSYLKISLLLLVSYNAIALLFLFLYTKTVNALIYGQLLSSIVVLPFAYVNMKRNITFYFSVDILRSTFKYSIPLFISITFAWILNMTDRLFLANLSSMKDAGVYSLASKFSQLAILFIGAIHQAYSPFFYNITNTMPYEVAKQKLIGVNKIMTLLICLICLMVAMFTKPALLLFFNEEFYGTITFVYLLSLSAIFTQHCGLLNVMVYQNKKVKSMAGISMACGALSLLLNSILIQKWGAIAAGISNLIVGITLFILTLCVAKRNYYIPISFKIIFGAIIALFCVVFADVMISDVLVNFVSKIVVLAVFLFLMFSIKELRYSELIVLFERSRK